MSSFYVIVGGGCVVGWIVSLGFFAMEAILRRIAARHLKRCEREWYDCTSPFHTLNKSEAAAFLANRRESA